MDLARGSACGTVVPAVVAAAECAAVSVTCPSARRQCRLLRLESRTAMAASRPGSSSSAVVGRTPTRVVMNNGLEGL